MAGYKVNTLCKRLFLSGMASRLRGRLKTSIRSPGTPQAPLIDY